MRHSKGIIRKAVSAEDKDMKKRWNNQPKSE